MGSVGWSLEGVWDVWGEVSMWETHSVTGGCGSPSKHAWFQISTHKYNASSVARWLLTMIKLHRLIVVRSHSTTNFVEFICIDSSSYLREAEVLERKIIGCVLSGGLILDWSKDCRHPRSVISWSSWRFPGTITGSSRCWVDRTISHVWIHINEAQGM